MQLNPVNSVVMKRQYLTVQDVMTPVPYTGCNDASTLQFRM